LKQTPMYRVYERIAPRIRDWPVLMTKLGEMLRRDYDWSEGVAKIKAPTMIAVGDADSVRAAHAVEFFELLGGGKSDAGWDGSGMTDSRLFILPGVTHYTSFSSPELAREVVKFLAAPVKEMRT
jgi:pimeloyl-ACP methyl ester carboxylesterase